MGKLFLNPILQFSTQNSEKKSSEYFSQNPKRNLLRILKGSLQSLETYFRRIWEEFFPTCWVDSVQNPGKALLRILRQICSKSWEDSTKLLRRLCSVFCENSSQNAEMAVFRILRELFLESVQNHKSSERTLLRFLRELLLESWEVSVQNSERALRQSRICSESWTDYVHNHEMSLLRILRKL